MKNNSPRWKSFQLFIDTNHVFASIHLTRGIVIKFYQCEQYRIQERKKNVAFTSFFNKYLNVS